MSSVAGRHHQPRSSGFAYGQVNQAMSCPEAASISIWAAYSCIHLPTSAQATCHQRNTAPTDFLARNLPPRDVSVSTPSATTHNISVAARPRCQSANRHVLPRRRFHHLIHCPSTLSGSRVDTRCQNQPTSANRKPPDWTRRRGSLRQTHLPWHEDPSALSTNTTPCRPRPTAAMHSFDQPSMQN